MTPLGKGVFGHVAMVADAVGGGGHDRGPGWARDGGGSRKGELQQGKPGGAAPPSGSSVAATKRSAIEGIQRLRPLPGTDAAKIIVTLGLADSSGDVRHEAYRALMAGKDDPEVGAFLLRTLNRESRVRKKGLSCAVPLVMVLLAAKPAETQRDLAKFLDAFAALPENVGLLVNAADELGAPGRQRLAHVVAADDGARVLFENLRLPPRRWSQALVRIREPKAIEALIELLSRTDGLVHGDILAAPVRWPARFPGAGDQAWIGWWKKHKDNFHFPPGDVKPSGAGRDR